MHIIVDLNITADEYLRWYRGHAQAVFATSRDGKRIRFPAQALQRFVTHAGVQGTFAVYYDESNKLISIERLK